MFISLEWVGLSYKDSCPKNPIRSHCILHFSMQKAFLAISCMDMATWEQEKLLTADFLVALEPIFWIGTSKG